MPPAPRRWIRLDVGWSDSDWIGALEPGGRLAWVELLAYTKRDGSAGIVKALTPAAFARKIRVSTEDVSAMLEAARSDGALIDDDGSWIVANWPEFQETDPTAAERMRKYRAERSRLSPLHGVTRNPTVQPVTGGVTRHATETETERTETDKQILAQPNGVEPIDADFERLWSNRPRREGSDPKKAARKAWNARRREGIAAQTMVDAHARYGLWCQATKKLGTEHVMRASTFLGDPEYFANAWTVKAAATDNGARGNRPGTYQTPDWEYRQPLHHKQGEQ
jgi:hypothetical protein